MGALVLFPLLIAILRALMWALCVNPKLQEMGRILFFVGAFVTVLRVQFPGDVIKLFGGG